MSGSMRPFHAIIGSLLVVASLVLAPFNVTAAPPDAERQKVVVEMFKSMRYAKMIDQMALSVGQQVQKIVRKKNPQIDERILTDIPGIFREEFLALKPRMMLFVGNFMARQFSVAELKQLTRFYKTPVGMKAIQILPQMMQEMTPWITRNSTRIQQNSLARIQALLKKHGKTL